MGLARWQHPMDGVTGQGLRFAAVGTAATGAQLALYAFGSGPLGPQLANVCAWIVSTLLANAAHQRYTFRVEGRARDADHLVGMVTSLAGLALASAALFVLDEPAGVDGTVALVAVNAVVGVARYLALRWWWSGRSARSTGSSPLGPGGGSRSVGFTAHLVSARPDQEVQVDAGVGLLDLVDVEPFPAPGGSRAAGYGRGAVVQLRLAGCR